MRVLVAIAILTLFVSACTYDIICVRGLTYDTKIVPVNYNRTDRVIRSLENLDIPYDTVGYEYYYWGRFDPIPKKIYMQPYLYDFFEIRCDTLPDKGVFRPWERKRIDRAGKGYIKLFNK